MEQLQRKAKRARRWMVAALLCICMIMTLIPVEYYGISLSEPGPAPLAGPQEILSFAGLPAEISEQAVELGTPRGRLSLPASLSAYCRPAAGAPESEAGEEPADTEQPTEATEEPADTELPDESPADTETPGTELPEEPAPEDSETPDSPGESDPSDSETPDVPDENVPADSETPDVPDENVPADPGTSDEPGENPPANQKPPVVPDENVPADPGTSNEPAQPEETAPAQDAPNESAAGDGLSVETSTVTIKENYAMPESATRVRKLDLSPKASASEAGGGQAADIPVLSWTSSPEYDGETEGSYLFTPVLPSGYTLAEGVALPAICVTVTDSDLFLLSELATEEEEEDETPLTPMCGIVSRDVTWTEGGTLENGTLAILPGVTLTIMGALEIKGTVTITGGGTIVRGSGDAYFSVTAGNTLSIQGVSINGNGVSSSESMIKATMGTVTLGDGCRITNCVKTVSGSNNWGGAAIWILRGTARLSNTEISGCSSSVKGGAIYAEGAIDVTIESGTYSGNSTTNNAFGGGFLYNDTSNVTISGGSFLNNTSAGRGGCIYHGGTNGTTTNLSGGLFSGNTSTYPGNEGSGAIWISSVSSGTATLTLSGAAQFAGAGGTDGTDGIYLDKQNDTPRKVYIDGSTVHPIRIYLEAEEDYVIAEGSGSTTLENRDMKKILFVDTANSGTWYAKLEDNKIKTVSMDPDYGLFIDYDNNGATGDPVKDPNAYRQGDEVVVLPADGLTYEGRTFSGWNTMPDGTGDHYMPGDTITVQNDMRLYAVFPASCVATFYSGEDNEKEEIDGTESNGIITAPQLKQIAGYARLGWTSDPDGYEAVRKPNDTFTLDADTSFYGVYKKNVTLSFDANGGDSVAPRTKSGDNFINVHEETTYKNHEFTLDPAVTRDGYSCIGWTETADNTGTIYEYGSSYSSKTNVTLYAYWQADGETSYRVEHYKQTVEGDGYELSEADTQNLSAPTGSTVTATAKSYDGFIENTTHPDRLATGEVAPDGSLVLRLYYDRDGANIAFDLNGAPGTPPAQQHVSYGGSLQPVEDPAWTGWTFSGWYKEKDASGSSWDFDKTAMENGAASGSVTLYAKWTDVTPPVLGEASFNEGYMSLLNWIIRKKDLIITVPVTEEGSGVKEASYRLEPDGATGARAANSLPAKVETEDGLPVVKIGITEDFKGKVIVSCTDHAENTSPEKSVTAENGGIIAEDSAPFIRFSSGGEELSEYYYDSAKITVFVEDAVNADEESQISGGISEISYQIDDGEPVPVATEPGFDEEIVTSCMFDADVATYGKPVLKVTAKDNAGNVSEAHVELDIRRRQKTYRVEHYTQDANGTTYTKETSETQTFSEMIGTEVAATANAYTGFHENTAHPDRVASGIVSEEGTLVLKLYYDRDLYEISYSLNGASGTAPEKQAVLYGTARPQVAAPSRTGYEFKGWYLDAAGTDGMLWDDSRTVDRNISAPSATLYAKWADELPPVLGDASYNKGYRRILDLILRKPDLEVTVPITEEGSGIREATYILMPDDGDLKEKKARIETKNGQTAAKLSISYDFAGAVALSASDKAGNVSAEKLLTAENGGIIVEDTAPEIIFSTKNGKLSDTFSDSVTVNVSVTDLPGNQTVSGGLASIACKLDGKEYGVSEDLFEEDMTPSADFSVRVSGDGTHSLSVTAADNLGNRTTRTAKIKIKAAGAAAAAFAPSQTPGAPSSPGREPKTGDSSQIWLYALAAALAGLAYLLLLFGSGLTREGVQKDIKRLSRWAKKGGRIRKMLAMTAAFLLLACYNSIGKLAEAK